MDLSSISCHTSHKAVDESHTPHRVYSPRLQTLLLAPPRGENKPGGHAGPLLRNVGECLDHVGEGGVGGQQGVALTDSEVAEVEPWRNGGTE